MRVNGRVRAISIGVLLVGAVLGGSAILGSAGATTAQDASASFETVNDTVRVHPTDGVEVRGETSLEPGTQVKVIARSTAEGNTFLRTPTVEVQEDGTFAAEMDFTGQDVGVEFTVSVRHNGTVIAESDAKIVSEDTKLYPSDGGSDEGSLALGPMAAVLAVCGAALLASWRT